MSAALRRTTAEPHSRRKSAVKPPGRLPAEEPSPGPGGAQLPRRLAETQQLLEQTRRRRARSCPIGRRSGMTLLDEGSSHARTDPKHLVVASSVGQGSVSSSDRAPVSRRARQRSSCSRMGNGALEAPGRGGGAPSPQARSLERRRRTLLDGPLTRLAEAPASARVCAEANREPHRGCRCALRFKIPAHTHLLRHQTIASRRLMPTPCPHPLGTRTLAAST